MSIINDLYYGKIQPSTKEIDSDSEYRQEQLTFCDIANVLHSKLEESEQRMLDQLVSIMGNLTDLSCSESFADGFKLGIKIMVEIYNDNSS